MKRRDFNRMALGIGLSPLLANRSLAQWYEGPSPPTQRAAAKIQYRHQEFPADVQPGQRATQVRRWPSIYHLLDLELSLGSQSRCDRIGQSLFDHDGGASGGMAKL